LEELLQTPVEKIRAPLNLVTLRANQAVPYALNILLKNNIYSAPVYDDSKHEWVGFLDIMDIVTLIVEIFDSQEEKHKTWMKKQDDLYTLLEQVEKFDLCSAGRIVDLSRRNPMVPLQKGSPVLHAIQLVAETGLHRVPIMEDGKLVNVISVSAIVAWLAQHQSAISDFSKKKLKEIRMGRKEVVTVTVDTLAIDAFRLMAEKRISGVGVVDHDGTLFTNISMKDIKVIAKDALFTKLYYTTLDFVRYMRSQIIEAKAAVMAVTPESTVWEVLKKFEAWKVHRIYIIDERKSPIGVVSLQDIVAALVNQPEVTSSL
jgi:predicted transcriptional regulator